MPHPNAPNPYPPLNFLNTPYTLTTHTHLLITPQIRPIAHELAPKRMHIPLLELLQQRERPVLIRVVVDPDGAPQRSQPRAYGSADAARCAGYEGDFALEGAFGVVVGVGGRGGFG